MRDLQPAAELGGRVSRTRRTAGRTTISFDADGVCDACRFAEQKQRHDRLGRARAELRELCDRYRSNDGSYDCVVPGSGGKDSFYAAHMLKYKYGMHPLTVTWAPHIYTEWGWKQLPGVDPRRLRQLPVHAERARAPAADAARGREPVPPVPAVHPRPEGARAEDGAAARHPAGVLRRERGRIRQPDRRHAIPRKRDWSLLHRRRTSRRSTSAAPRSPTSTSTSASTSTTCSPTCRPIRRSSRSRRSRCTTSATTCKWHPQSCYYYAVEHGGFQASPERTPGTYSKYNSIDDRIDDFHYYTTCIKFGIGRATYDAAQEIRSGDITREEGVALVKRFDGEFPERFAEEIFRYLSIPANEFPAGQRACSSSRSWTASTSCVSPTRSARRTCGVRDDGEWKLRHAVWQTTGA